MIYLFVTLDFWIDFNCINWCLGQICGTSVQKVVKLALNDVENLLVCMIS